MARIDYELGDAPVINLDNVTGDLRITGWMRQTVQLKADDDTYQVDEGNEALTVVVNGDAHLYVPSDATLKIGNVSGSARLKELSGPLSIDSVSGDCRVRGWNGNDVMRIGQVTGELRVRSVVGSVHVQHVSGDVEARSIEGSVTIDQTSGTMYLRDIEQGVHVVGSGDATVRLLFAAGHVYNIETSGDLSCRVLPGSSARIVAQAGGDLSADVEGSVQEAEDDDGQSVFVMGDGEAEVRLSAQGDLNLIARRSYDDSDAQWQKLDDEFASWATFGVDIAESITSDVLESLGDLSGVIDDDRLESKRRRIEAKAERARKRAEAKMRRHAARVRAQADMVRRQADQARGQVKRPRVRVNIDFDADSKKDERPSEEERVAILKMLEEGKITIDQAETLLQALDGNA